MGEETKRQDNAHDSQEKARGISPLEIATTALGAFLTLGMLTFIGWEALSERGDAPPLIEVARGELTVAPSGELFVVQFEAVNRSPRTAEEVEIEGVLHRDGQTVETSRAVLGFVPGGSSRQGGLFFTVDPTGHHIELRALGYSDP